MRANLSPMKNFFQNIPKNLPNELFETLVQTDKVHIERIVSKGHSSPAEGWYEQDQAEWILVLKGAARLGFADKPDVSLEAGDYLEIPARLKHKVLWTDPQQETVWLAVHYSQ